MDDKKFENEFIISDMPDEQEAEKTEIAEENSPEFSEKAGESVSEEEEKTEEKKAKKQSSLSKEQKSFLAFVGGAWLVIVAVLVVSLCIKTNLSKEPPMDLGNNENIQVKIMQQIIIPEGEEETEEMYDEQLGLDENIYTDESYYYDENVNMVTESTTSEETETQDQGYLLAEIKKNGTTYFFNTASDATEEEHQNNYKAYYYQKDGKLYKTYYHYDSEMDYIMNPESGKWAQAPADSSELNSYFDFSVLDKYDESDFVKVEDYYIPASDVNGMFFDIVNTYQPQNYSNCDIKYYISNGKMTKIVISYTYAGSREPIDVVQTYEFTYKNEKISVPKAEIELDGQGK